MSYGKYNNFVQEVIEFIKKGQLFKNAGQSLLNIKSVEDYEIAKELAWSQDLEIVDSIWQDIKANEGGSLLGIILSDDNLKSMDDELSDIFSSNDNYADDFIPMDYWDIAEEVESDLYKCAINRMVNGKIDNFYENVFRIYQSGGWPCGWKGSYPDGNMIVFFSAK